MVRAGQRTGTGRPKRADMELLLAWRGVVLRVPRQNRFDGRNRPVLARSRENSGKGKSVRLDLFCIQAGDLLKPVRFEIPANASRLIEGRQIALTAPRIALNASHRDFPSVRAPRQTHAPPDSVLI